MFGLTKATASTPAISPPPPLAPDLPAPYPVFTTLSDANAYRRDLTTALCDAARQGDCTAVEALQTRSAALPLLIAGLVSRLVQERVTGWQTALQRYEQQIGAAEQAEQSAWAAYKQAETTTHLSAASEAFTTAKNAAKHTFHLRETRQQLDSEHNAAREMARLAKEALALTVSNPTAGLIAADTVLHRLEVQQAVFVKLATVPLPPVENLPPFLAQMREAIAV